MESIHTIIVDDHPLFRKGLCQLLYDAGITVIGEFSSGEEAIEKMRTHIPDLIKLDMELSNTTGIEVMNSLKESNITIPILVLSGYDDREYISEALNHGASGYLLKDEAPELIIDAIHGILNGEEGWFSRRVAAKFIKKNPEANQPLVLLTDREQQVLRLVAQGYDNTEISTLLCLSEMTVKNYTTKIYAKLNVRTRAQATAWAWANRLIEDVDIHTQ